jgi:hypothetical protein
MDVQLSLVDDYDGVLLEDLQGWLSLESELRGAVAAVQTAPRPGELGTVTDALAVALGGGGTLTVLAASLRAWFAQPRRSDVRIVIRDADGRSVEVDAKRVTDVQALLIAVLPQARGGADEVG